MKYKITGKTNGYIASRDINFNGKCEIVIESGMTLREAQEKLLDMFNHDYDTSFRNWGLVRCNHPMNTATSCDGTRSYDYDSRYYSIDEEE